MVQHARKALIIGLRLGSSIFLAYELAALGLQVWVASGDEAELSSLRPNDNIFVHRIYPNRNASIYEVLDAIDRRSGALDFVLIEAGNTDGEIIAERLILDQVITVISQSIRRMVPFRQGWIFVHDNRLSRRNSWFASLLTKTQSLKKLVETAAAEVQPSSVKIQYLAAAENVNEIEYLGAPSTAHLGPNDDGVREWQDVTGRL